MELDADGLIRLVDRGAHVAVLAVAVLPQQLHGQLDHLVDAVVRIHHQDLGRVHDALEVLARLEQVELLLVRVPVGADALEDRRPVQERVGHDADLGLRQRRPRVLEPTYRVVLRASAGTRAVGVGRGFCWCLGGLLRQHGREYTNAPPESIRTLGSAPGWPRPATAGTTAAESRTARPRPQQWTRRVCSASHPQHRIEGPSQVPNR